MKNTTTHTLRITAQVLPFCFTAPLIVNAQADWTLLGGGSLDSGRQNTVLAHDRLSSPTWETGAENLQTGGSVVVLPGSPYRLIAWSGDDNGTPFNGADDMIFAKAFNADTGAPSWTSPILAAGSTLSFGSTHTAGVDTANNRVLMGTGGTLYSLNGADGTIFWNTPLNAGGSTEVVNGSVTVGGSRAFITSYGGFTPASKRLYAISLATGGIDWSVQDGGPGSEAPIFLNIGGTDTVTTLNANGMSSYNAATGTLIWSAAAPLAGADWSTTNTFFGGLTHHEGVLYAGTYNFGGTAQFVAVNAATGERLWERANTINGSGTPTVLGNRVYHTGHLSFGFPSYLVAYNKLTGVEELNLEINSDSTTYSISPTAFNDALVMTLGSVGFSAPGTPSGLRVLNPATGLNLLTPTANGDLGRGTPALGANGEIYVLRDGGKLAAYLPVQFASATLVDADSSTGAGVTDNQTVTVNITGAYATEMRLSEGSLGSEPFVPFSASSSFVLSAGTGLKTVNIQLRNGSSTSAVQQATIQFNAPSSVEDWAMLE
ncbi:MAG: PQQ-binding-like beta-propeller repeat protein [Candidatus Sumerlaeia bacterium]|nr:PQQ-binding-like beta-propeller repeat protein [Candidatus Sumerlaeia bacterium]